MVVVGRGSSGGGGCRTGFGALGRERNKRVRKRSAEHTRTMMRVGREAAGPWTWLTLRAK